MIILISGKQGSGKTTTSDALAVRLREIYGENEVYRTRYAKILYKMHDAVRDIGREYGLDLPEKNGFLLQILGTEWGRNKVADDVWIKTVRADIAKQNAKFVIIDDMRFKNEFHAFDDTEVLKIRLEAPQDVRKARCDGWRDTENHPSETNLDDYLHNFDLVLDTSSNDLNTVLDQILLNIQER
jgi:phosphomevalonate kinase